MASASAAELTPFQTDVNGAIDAGLTYMRANNWFTTNTNANGLQLLALLEKNGAAGYSGLDDADKLLARQSACMLMGASNYGSRGYFYAYYHGQVLMALSVYSDTGGPDNVGVTFGGYNCQTDATHTVRYMIGLMVDQTLAVQANGANGGCTGMWSYTGPGCDSSTTQYAVAGLAAAKGFYTKNGESADKNRLPLIQSALNLTAAAYDTYGDIVPAKYCTFDTCGTGGCKGHSYSAGSGYGSASNQQTASGTWAQLLGADKNVNDASIQGYLRWGQNAYSYDSNIYYESWPQFYFYYLYSSSKAYGLMEASGIFPDSGKIGPRNIGKLPSVTQCGVTRQLNRNPDVDTRPASRGEGAAGYYKGTTKGWYYDYAYRLMGLQQSTGYFQNPNGSWGGGGYYADHAYALLVLLRSLGGACIDADGDKICDAVDNCPTVANPDQKDSNGDGFGDVCQSIDTDKDGITDQNDNCPTVANPDQKDSDGNGIGDRCEDQQAQILLCDADANGSITMSDLNAVYAIVRSKYPVAVAVTPANAWANYNTSGASANTIDINDFWQCYYVGRGMLAKKYASGSPE